ncbi:MAG: type IV secretory system conjugative DNA transfer family protein [Lachnospiraceae bacterium]|nr:type IV secretory system conjugative DNA transfer family protein [Lachnospiraceae bacterium]
MKRDLTCLAENMVYPADSSVTGINLNEIIVGATGCGKSMSLAYPRLAHTYDSSIVIPITKGDIMKKFSKLFKSRGYKVHVMDFTKPEKSTIIYDPLDYVKTNEDAIHLAKSIVKSAQDGKGSYDPFWDNAAESVIASIVLLLKENEKNGGKKASFDDLIEMFRNMKLNTRGSRTNTSIDCLFDELDKKKPGNKASMLFTTLRMAPEKTAGTIYCCVNNVIDKFMSESITRFVSTDKKISFRELGKKKSVLFIKSSPMNTALYSFINVMYKDMFRDLFEAAEASSNGRLDVPVHIVCDDFATGGRIPDFEDYISIFRAAGISVSILLQSESQLYDMYGEGAGKTIINNCDTYVYMGGMDYETCFNISRKMNKPIEKIISLPKEEIIVFRRGMEPKFAKRYQTLEDPEYIKAMEL